MGLGQPAVVACGDANGSDLVWDSAASRTGTAELGHHHAEVWAVAALPGGQVVTGGDDGRVLVWDPAHPGADPAELGRVDGGCQRWRCCPAGR